MEKHYHFETIEKQMQEFWEQNQIYKFNPNKKGPVYSVDTPPPTVSGSLHIGHIFSFVQAEMNVRFRRMQGYNIFYPFGFDDNGLPTERLVERDEKIRARFMPRSTFAKKCMAVTQKYEEEFKCMWKSLGFSVDWSLQYTTISPEVTELSQKLFLELVKQKKAYFKESPVLWCTDCQTSIAQAELDTKETKSVFHYLPFHTGEDVIEVATTRPELLYGCVCLFVNPADERYTKYIGKTARVPLYDYEIPIMADEKVSIDKGTGAVMCATFGDSTDAEWAESYHLPYRRVICPDGTIDNSVPGTGGMKIPEARAEIVRLLSEKGLLLKSEKITHTVAIHERCGTETEIIPSRQWYIDILSEKERFLKAADEINWYPVSMKKRYLDWVSNLKWDWCISRQRYFGIPFPVWYCKNCKKPFFAEPEQLPVNPLETPLKGDCECGCKEFLPENAVFDTWATSSVTPQINERFGIPLIPMSVRVQGPEIIRTWTFYTIVRSLYHTGKLPWKDIMISGFVLAKKGEKISKSKNNSALSPTELIAAYSADAIRYWATGAKLGTDTFFSTDDLAAARRFLTKLWNSCRFSLSHLQDIDLTEKPELMPIDRWIIARTKDTIKKIQAFLYEYEIGSARREIDEFFWKDFCDNYIEIVKERLYRPDIHGEKARKSGQHALYHALLSILKLYAIYVPHITEYIYQEFFRQYEKEKSIHLLLWDAGEAGAETADIVTHADTTAHAGATAHAYTTAHADTTTHAGATAHPHTTAHVDTTTHAGTTAHPEDDTPLLLAFGESVIRILTRTRRFKSENNLSMRDKIDTLVIDVPENLHPFFRQTEKDLLACSKAGAVEYAPFTGET